MQHEPIWERARGQWPGILSAIGVPSKALRNKHGPCPVCGGKDRFRFDDKGGNGTWICSHCGAGTGVTLVEKFMGVAFKEAAREIEKHLGDAVIMPTASGQRSDDAKKREEMDALWKRAKPISLEDSAGRWLHRRVGLTEFPAALRHVADERYVEDGARPSWHPAMIARVDPSDEARERGERAALHRTYLDGQGCKAEVSSPRKMFGSMPTGAAVRLMPHGDTLGIGEGIETCLAASKLYGVPVWSALTEGLLQDWTAPAGVTTVFVFGDNDASFAGQAAAFVLAKKLKAKKLTVFVEIPPTRGTDWNDVLLKRGAS